MLGKGFKGNLFLISPIINKEVTEQEKYMHRCLQLAANGLGTTYPNPLVGCVIVHQGKIIGEGWHQRAGEAHAEVNAINSVSDKSLLPDSELYVNLEPCSHHGRTPPCADLIVRMKIPRVFIGSVDDNARVSGSGIERLRENGCQVVTGLLEKECRELNKRFFMFHQKQRPYVILKWAESADGFLFPSRDNEASGRSQKGPVWISNIYSRQNVHKWRAEEEAILVGTRTVEKDDPSLTVRDVAGGPILRLVIDRLGKLSWANKVFQGQLRTVVFVDRNSILKEVPDGLKSFVQTESLDFQSSLPKQILGYLFEKDVQSLIVEGGAVTLNSFLNEGLWDEARVFQGRVKFEKGLKAPELPGVVIREQSIGEDRLIWFKNEA